MNIETRKINCALGRVHGLTHDYKKTASRLFLTEADAAASFPVIHLIITSILTNQVPRKLLARAGKSSGAISKRLHLQ